MEKIMSYTITEVIKNKSDVKYSSWEDFSDNGLYSDKTSSQAIDILSADIKNDLSEDEWNRFVNISSNITITTEWDSENQIATRTKTYESEEDQLFAYYALSLITEPQKSDSVEWETVNK